MKIRIGKYWAKFGFSVQHGWRIKKTTRAPVNVDNVIDKMFRRLDIGDQGGHIKGSDMTDEEQRDLTQWMNEEMGFKAPRETVDFEVSGGSLPINSANDPQDGDDSSVDAV